MAPQYQKGIGEIEKWTSLVDNEFTDVYSEIERDDEKVPPEQIERGKRIEKRRKYGIGN